MMPIYKKRGDGITADPDFFAPANVGRIPYFWQNLKGESKSKFLMSLMRTYEPPLTTLPKADPDVLRHLVPVYDQILERFDCCAPQ